MSHNHSQSQASTGGPVQGPGPAPNPALDDEMLTPSDDEEVDEDAHHLRELRNLRYQTKIQAKMVADLQATVHQLTSQMMATPNEKPIKKPKMATPDKYDGSRTELRTFLTNIELYCGYNEVPNDEEKILMANTHMKGKAASWMQPYVEDFLEDIPNKGTKEETRKLFNAESQAEKAISHLKQTKSVSAYTAEFKQQQARINWDDSALRMTYENGLKEVIKDELVHYEKPKDLYSLIELATRIDTRLWERKEAQRGNQPKLPIANSRRSRSNKDSDGDTYMTGKVQDKSKDKNKKPRGKFNDGLSPEERKKRYDSKACLRCGEVGHFRRDCPKNESTKRIQETVRMLRVGTPYPTEEPDETLSDLDLYDEARQATNEAFELVQEAIGLQDFKWDDPLPTDWQIEGAEVLRRLRNQQCWICGLTTHAADDCDCEGRVTITGPRAEEIACRAAQEQPRFKEPEDEETPRTFKERMEQHERLCWVDCPRQCDYHLRKREETRDNEDDCCHTHLWHNECRAPHCYMHQPEKTEAHEELCWIKCKTNCRFHKEQRRKARRVDDYYHSTISAEECIAKSCRMHRAQVRDTPEV
ncbi:Retrotrans-gag domain containing protein [Pyrenophora tritici-repentis]|nr:Retrotrans-gag domain containing protein [Pyrenophora tritici-repentis]